MTARKVNEEIIKLLSPFLERTNPSIEICRFLSKVSKLISHIGKRKILTNHNLIVYFYWILFENYSIAVNIHDQWLFVNIMPKLYNVFLNIIWILVNIHECVYLYKIILLH